MKSADFLDAVKARHKLTSDYQLAKHLRWPQPRVSMYRTGRREFDDDSALQIAAELTLDPAYVLACIAAARAKRADIKRHWLAAARLLKTGTGAMIVAAVLATSQFAPGRAEASAVRLTGPSIHYAPRRRRRSGSLWRRRRRRKSQTVIPRTPIVAART